ncbi:MAG: site-2 protease family protein [Solirubrobacterales bacterium]|nr:site-2 protease family protein [Solirubrobacterales bacterium]
MRRGGSVQLAKVFGIRVGATPSAFFVLFVLIVVLSNYFQDVLDGSSQKAYLCAVAGALLFELSLILHELGHALTARRYGIGTTGIDLWFFGGVAKLDREADTPGQEFKVAAGGPLVTAVIVGICLGLGLLGPRFGTVTDAATLTQTTGATPFTAVVGYLAGINLLLLVFNLIPAFPLDGGRIAQAIAWKLTGDRNRGTRLSGRLGLGFSYVLIGGGLFLAVTGDVADGVWFMVLGWFMAQSARAAVVGSNVRETLEGVTAADIMAPDPLTMPPTVSALEAQEQWFSRFDSPFIVVAEPDGRYLGTLTAARVAGALADGRPVLPVRELLDDPDGHDAARVAPGLGLEHLLQVPALRAVGAVMVVDEAGLLRGVVTVEQVQRALTAAVPRR